MIWAALFDRILANYQACLEKSSMLFFGLLNLVMRGRQSALVGNHLASLNLELHWRWQKQQYKN